MTVSKNGFSAKHFQAWDPTFKFIHVGLYFNAKCRTAKKSLKELIQKAPLKLNQFKWMEDLNLWKTLRKPVLSSEFYSSFFLPNDPNITGALKEEIASLEKNFIREKISF